MAMYSYLPKVPFNDVAKDVLHPPEQPLCTSLEHPIAPYIVHADSDVVRDHAVQAYIPTNALDLNIFPLSTVSPMPPMPPMPAIPSLPFSPHLEVTNDLHLQPFPSSSRVDTQLQQPFVPQTAHPHLQNVDPATMAATHPFVDLHRHTPQQDLAVTQHDALDSTIDMAESLRDLSRYLSISQHLSDVQYDILNTDNPDFVLVPTSIDAGCYGFTPSDTQTHGTSQSVITRPRHFSMPAWFPNGHGSHITPLATSLVRSMSSLSSMQTTNHATSGALFSSNGTFSVSPIRDMTHATMFDVPANTTSSCTTNMNTTHVNTYPSLLGSDGGCAHRFTVTPIHDILQPFGFSPESTTGITVSSVETSSQLRPVTSSPQEQYPPLFFQHPLSLPSTMTATMPTAVSLAASIPIHHQQGHLTLTSRPIGAEHQISSSPVSVLSSSSSSSSSSTTWKATTGPIRRDRKVIGSRTQRKDIQFSALTEFPISNPPGASTKPSPPPPGTNASTNGALQVPNILKIFHWTPESFQERDCKPGDDIPKRPPNSFMLYRKDQCPGKSSGSNPTGVSGSQISIYSGQSWGGMTDDEKMHYRKLSEESRARFMAENPWYKFTRSKGPRQNGGGNKRKEKSKGKGKGKTKRKDKDEIIGKIKEEDMETVTSYGESGRARGALGGTSKSDAWSPAGATASTDEGQIYVILKKDELDNVLSKQAPRVTVPSPQQH